MRILEESYVETFTGETQHYFTVSGTAAPLAFEFDPDDPKSRRDARRRAGEAARNALPAGAVVRKSPGSLSGG